MRQVLHGSARTIASEWTFAILLKSLEKRLQMSANKPPRGVCRVYNRRESIQPKSLIEHGEQSA